MYHRRKSTSASNGMPGGKQVRRCYDTGITGKWPGGQCAKASKCWVAKCTKVRPGWRHAE